MSSDSPRILAVAVAPEVMGELQVLRRSAVVLRREEDAHAARRAILDPRAPDVVLLGCLDDPRDRRRVVDTAAGTGIPVLCVDAERPPDDHERGLGVRWVSPEDPDAVDSALASSLGNQTRLEIRVPARLEIALGEGSGRTVVCCCIDVSASGMGLETRTGYPVGARLAFELLLPGEEAVLAGSAEVVRSRAFADGSFRVGVRFQELPEDGGDRLRKWVAEARAEAG